MPREPEPSFKLKTIVWDVAAKVGKNDFSAIQRQLDYELEQLREEGHIFEDTPDTRTIRRIVENDINQLTKEVVVSTLPRHVWSLRQDYEDIKQLAEEGVLAEHIRIEQDPMIIEARRRHLDDLLTVVDELRDQLAVPPIHTAYLPEFPNLEKGLLFSLPWENPVDKSFRSTHVFVYSEGAVRLQCNVEGDKPELFESLCQHIPSLRDDYSGWQLLAADLLYACKELYKKIVDEAEQRTGLHFGLESAPRLCNFADCIYADLTYPLEMFDEPMSHYKIRPLPAGHYQLMLGPVVLAEGPSEAMISCLGIYKTMRRDYLASQNGTQLKRLSAQEGETEAKLQQQLKELSLRRIFPGKCKLCPD